MGFFDKMFGTKDAAATSRKSDIIDALAKHLRGDLDGALKAYLQIVEELPDDSLAPFLASAIIAGKGEVAEAAGNLRFLSQQIAGKGETISKVIFQGLAEQLSEAPYLGSHGIAEIVVSFGDLLKDAGFMQEGAVCFEIATGFAPDNAHILHKFGDTLHDLGRYDYAEAMLLEALKFAPNHWGALYTYGVLLQDLGRFDEAITCYEKAVKLNPDHVKCQNNYGAALLMTNRLDEALSHCILANELDPSFPPAKTNLGNIYLQMHRYEDARNCYKEAISLDKDLSLAYFGLGTAEQSLGSDSALVRELFLKAVALSPTIPNFHQALGNLLAREGSPEALVHFATAVQLNPDLEGLQRDFGSACLQLGRRAEAVEPLRMALQQNPEDGVARELLAQVEGEQAG